MASVIQHVSWAKRTLTTALALMLAGTSVVSQDTTDYTFRTKTELVLVNVTVRDKNGNPVRDLKREDFTVLEDNKAQQVVSFDLENTDAVLSTAATEAPLLGKTPSKTPAKSADVSQAIATRPLKDRRLIILFFDLSAMQPDEIDHATTAAQNYVEKQMVPADLVSIVSLGSSLTVNQDFTSDRALLKKTLQDFNLGAGGGFEEGSTGTTEGTAETGGSFTTDDTEYNIFNTDRRLQALRSIADKLSSIEEKKSLIYFSSGMDRTGIENQSQLRSATNAAVKANMAIYTMDIRGLQALVAGGEAQNASLRGTSPYSGKSMSSAFDSNFTTQETLVTLAGRHRGTRVSRFERLRPRVYRGSAGHFSLLSAGLSQLELCAGRSLSPHHGAGEPAGREDRFPPRILRSGGFPARHSRRSRTATGRRTCFRPAHN